MATQLVYVLQIEIVVHLVSIGLPIVRRYRICQCPLEWDKGTRMGTELSQMLNYYGQNLGGGCTGLSSSSPTQAMPTPVMQPGRHRICFYMYVCRGTRVWLLSDRPNSSESRGGLCHHDANLAEQTDGASRSCHDPQSSRLQNQALGEWYVSRD